MTPRRDEHDHYGAPKRPDPSVQFTGLPLLDQAPEPERARLAREATIDARFQEFHADHPEVLEELERRVKEFADAGRKCSVRMAWDNMRYENTLHGPTDGSGYKLNDHYTSRYARLILTRHPEWRGDVIELRELRSA